MDNTRTGTSRVQCQIWKRKLVESLGVIQVFQLVRDPFRRDFAFKLDNYPEVKAVKEIICMYVA